MKKAFSQIAWSMPDAPAVHALLLAHGFTGIEVAPTKIWPDWVGATPAAAAAYQRALAAEGLTVPALQAILFGKPNARLFGTPEQQAEFVEHLTLVAQLANALEAPVVVIGAPKNRLRGDLSSTEADSLALPIFEWLGSVFQRMGSCLCIEANPADYGCDYLTTTTQVRDMVVRVGSPGIGLHVDTAQLLMGGEHLSSFVDDGACPIRHVHLSEPFLEPLDRSAKVAHRDNMATLEQARYTGWVSVEMREAPGDATSAIRETLCRIG